MMVAAAVMASSHAPSVAEPLQPTSKWNVDYDIAQCTAARDYGTEEKPLFLIFKPSPFGNTMRILFIRKGSFSSLASEVEASLQFGEGPRKTVNALKFASSDRQKVIYSVNLPTSEFKEQQSAKSVSIAAQGIHESFALESLPAVIEALEKCRVDLLQMYNADGSRVRESAEPVKPLQDIYSPGDYPSVALRNHDQGTVAFTLLVDESGKVVDCSVDSSAGAATLDTMSCYVIQERARFRPAIGLDGKPVRSVWAQRIRWRLKY